MRRLACGVLMLSVFTACSSGGGAPQGNGAPAGGAALQGQPPAPAPAASTPAASAAAPPPGSAPPPAASAAAAAPEPRHAAARDVTIPSGTTLAFVLETTVSSDKSHVEDAVRARLATPVVVDGTTVLPADTPATGTVVAAQQSGRVKGRASVAFRFTHLQAGDVGYEIRTARIAREAEATKGQDAKKIGIGAGAGAVIGAIAGGKKGLAIGTAVGAGAGTGAVVATRGKEVQFALGATVKTTLQESLVVHVAAE